jgi:putative peptidoglycan lipid II flippase
MPEGAIAHLGYAFKLVAFLVAFIPSGITAVVFPRMAFDMTMRDLDGVRRTISLAMRVMWLGVAPLIAVGAVLAYPFIAVLLERNAFVAADTAQVALLWQIYLLSLIGACLGSVTGRAFYAMKATRTIAVMGVVEAVAYAVYTSYLAWHLGVAGVAIGYVVYYSLSIGWQVPVLMRRLGGTGGLELFSSFSRTLAAALVAGGGAYVVLLWLAAPWSQLIGGGIVAGAIYLVCLTAWGGSEVRWTTQTLRGMAVSWHS